ncbi:MAG: type II secretion system F family protein [Planctomycetota bacterium]|nr:type II secretion system F family protein [Planctomycetota bacterium]
MVELLIPILIFVAVLAVGSAVTAALIGRSKSIQMRLRLNDSASGVEPSAGGNGLAGVLGRMAAAFSFGATPKLKKELANAGYYGDAAAQTYIGLKLLLLFFGLAATALALIPLDLALPIKINLTIFVAVVLFFVPNLVARARRNKRRSEAREFLPDAVDLLEVCVSAGMGLDMAWNSVSDEVRRVSPVLADEMALTNLEIRLGASRTDAMRHMAERTGANELSSLVVLLVQAERFGTSVADALRLFANTMRTTRSERAEEAAEKMAVKLLFPLVLFIFPVMLIVMAGPAAITLVRVIG